MARLLDTREIAPPNVGDVVNDLFAHNTVPLDVAVDTTAPLIIDAARVGHASLLSTFSHDLWLRRSERQTDLLRALVASASEVRGYARPALAEALLPTILAYVRQHLREQNLTPQRIARHHNISLRYLYKLCASADIRLMDWVVEQRLDGARQDLFHPDDNARTIAAIAYRWGFKDPRHFSARFRQSYGLSPREWRASAATISGESPRRSMRVRSGE